MGRRWPAISKEEASDAAGGGRGELGLLSYSKLSGIIIASSASTQLRARSVLDCPYSPLDFNPFDLVSLDSTRLLSAVNCWLKRMLLDPYNQTDNLECKSRPDSGLSAITELDPGYITGSCQGIASKELEFIHLVISVKKVSYYFAPSGKPYPDNWLITDVIYKYEGALLSRSGNSVSGSPGDVSGDGTVPYHSLAWCKTWLGSKVNITRAPQSEHDGSDVQIEIDVEHHQGKDFPVLSVQLTTKILRVLKEGGQQFGNWIKHDIHPDAKSKFVTKATRGPLRDVDCYWDYAKARCSWPEYCEYRYNFRGRSPRPNQSCRLKFSSVELLSLYL